MIETTLTNHALLDQQTELHSLIDKWTPKTQIDTLKRIELIAKIKLRELYSSDSKYIWASDSPNFKYAFFGRDSATVAENLASRPEYQTQCCAWLVSLAEYQGEKTSTKSDERLGAIPHEIRSLNMAGQEVDERAKELFETLRPRWSEDPNTDTIVYYGELDGPARFILACAELARNGVDLTQISYTHMSGKERNLLSACGLAAMYIQERRKESDLDLVELQPPKNEETLTNQTLKDSKPAYLHVINGKPVLPNREEPRAPLEAQLLSYEALLAYAELIYDTNPNKANDWRKHADSLKSRVLEYFVVTQKQTDIVMPQSHLAAMMDRDPDSGMTRLLNTRMSDAAEGMEGEFFKGDDPTIRDLNQSITRMILSDDFLTDGGIRCRALSDRDLFDFAEYHGSLPNWIVVTHAVAKGQLEQGRPHIALELWTRMLCAIIVSGRFQEFCYFDEQGRILLPERPDTSSATCVLRAEEHSQDNQAWSISAVLEAIGIMTNINVEDLPSRDKTFEDELLASIKEYRNCPQELITSLNQNKSIYKLEQMTQLAGAHEVDLSLIGNNRPVVRPID